MNQEFADSSFYSKHENEIFHRIQILKKSRKILKNLKKNDILNRKVSHYWQSKRDLRKILVNFGWKWSKNGRNRPSTSEIVYFPDRLLPRTSIFETVYFPDRLLSRPSTFQTVYFRDRSLSRPIFETVCFRDRLLSKMTLKILKNLKKNDILNRKLSHYWQNKRNLRKNLVNFGWNWSKNGRNRPSTSDKRLLSRPSTLEIVYFRKSNISPIS